MKFSQIGRITKASVLSLAIGLGMTACSSNYTIDYLYVTCAKAVSGTDPDGNISAYKIDNQSGALTQIVDSPYKSGGQDPVAIVVAPNQRALFVVNRLDSSIVVFAIGTDGKIYPKNTYIPASGVTLPVAEAISPDGKFLAVAYTYQPTFSITTPGPGAIVVYPVTYASDFSTASLGTPITMGTLPYLAVGLNPISVAISPQPNGIIPTANSLYVAEQTPTQGTVLTLGLNATTGVLTNVATTPAGVSPFSLVVEPRGHFLYITDQTANQLIGYVIQANGSLNPMVNGPFPTGQQPRGIAADPRGQYLYVTNYNTSTVTGYAIDQSTGTPSGVLSNGSSATDTGPTCVTIEPSRGLYLYTSNFVGNTASGLQLDPHNGALVNVQNSPFNAAGQPTCAATASAGPHAVQALQP